MIRAALIYRVITYFLLNASIIFKFSANKNTYVIYIFRKEINRDFPGGSMVKTP